MNLNPYDPYKVCPECGGEYRLEILRCPDCDVDLKTALAERQVAEEPEELYDELPTEEEKQSAFIMPAPPRHEIPASDDLVCLCCGALSELAALWPALDDAGIGHRIERAPYRKFDADCCLYLRPEDCDAAERIWKTVSATDGVSSRKSERARLAARACRPRPPTARRAAWASLARPM
jgi:hypothetical protein